MNNTKVENCALCENPNYPVPHNSCMYPESGGGHAGRNGRGHCTADLCW